MYILNYVYTFHWANLVDGFAANLTLFIVGALEQVLASYIYIYLFICMYLSIYYISLCMYFFIYLYFYPPLGENS